MFYSPCVNYGFVVVLFSTRLFFLASSACELPAAYDTRVLDEENVFLIIILRLRIIVLTTLLSQPTNLLSCLPEVCIRFDAAQMEAAVGSRRKSIYKESRLVIIAISVLVPRVLQASDLSPFNAC